MLVFKELPRVVEWENNSSLLCPFEVDEENLIDDSGGHTLQVCFSSKCLGGGVLGEGYGEEELRFCACSELLVTRLIMEPLDENEAVIVTVSGREGGQPAMCGGGVMGGWTGGDMEGKRGRWGKKRAWCREGWTSRKGEGRERTHSYLISAYLSP